MGLEAEIENFILFGERNDIHSPNFCLKELHNGELANEIKNINSKFLKITGGLDQHLGKPLDLKQTFVENCQFEKILVIGFDEDFELVLRNCCISGDIVLHDCNFNLVIEDSTFHKISVTGESNVDLLVQKCKGSVYIESSKDYTNPIRLIEGHFRRINILDINKGEILLYNVKCDSQIVILNYTVDPRFSLNKSTKNIESRPSINHLNIVGSTSAVRVKHYDIDLIELDHFINTGNSIFDDLLVSTLSIHNSINSGIIDFIDLASRSDDSKLIIKNSELGKFKLINADLTSFTEITIENTNLKDILSIGTKWPVKINESNYTHQREFFRQLKSVMANSQDKVNELLYHRREMEAYLEQIKNEKGSFWERLNLLISKESNDFGHNYIKPAWQFFYFGFWFYFGVLLLSDIPLSFIFERPDTYIEFLNPVHKLSFLEGTGYKVSPWSSIPDFLGRIILAFYIFQFVSAFRKYYKK